MVLAVLLLSFAQTILIIPVDATPMHQYRLHPFYRFISSLLIVTTLILTYEAAYAQADFGSIGRGAQQLGKDLADDFNQNSPSLSGNTLEFDGGQQININDLYPATSSTNTRSNSQYFPDDYDQNVDHYKSIYDSGSQMDSAGNAALSSMYADAILDEPVSIQGQAYKIIMDTANRPRPDMTYDPIANVTRDIIGDFGIWEESFGDCSVQSELIETTKKIHVPDIQHCERLFIPEGNCTIEHHIKVDPKPADVLFLIDNSGSMESIIAGIRNNVMQFAYLLGGDEKKVRLGGIITRSGYQSNKIDLTYDYTGFQNWVSRIRIDSGTTYVTEVANYALDNYTFREGVEKVMVIIGNEDSPGGDYAALRQRLINMGITAYIFHDHSATRSLGIHIANVFNTPDFFRVAQLLTVVEDYWTPQSCIDDAVTLLEGVCEGQYEVTQPESIRVCDKDFFGRETNCRYEQPRCSIISGFEVCPGDPIYEMLKPPPLPDVRKIDREVYVHPIQCDWYNNRSNECWEDAHGELQCDDGKKTENNDCKELEENPQCGYIRSICAEYAEGSHGTCYIYDDEFDCGTSVEVPNLDRDQSYECHGEIQCMGSDCLDFDYESNQDFAKVAALLESAQYMAQDMTCTGLDSQGSPTGNEPVVCKVFPGDSNECKRIPMGIQNCCKGVGGVSLTDYIVLLKSAGKIDSALMSLNEASAIRSGYKAIRDPITGAWSEVTEMFINVPDGVSGAFDLVTDPIGTVQDKLLEHAQNLFNENFAIGLSNALTVIGYIYAAYNVIKILANMIWPCKKSELELQVDIKLKKCHYNGSYCNRRVPIIGCVDRRRSYCCFSSPLSRILQEQIRRQLGISWGSAENPRCGALTLEQIEQVDWDKVNLDEWIGILQSTGNWPSSQNLSIESLTGPSNPLNYDGTRVNAIDRAMGRFEGSDVDAVREDLSKTYKPYPTP